MANTRDFEIETEKEDPATDPARHAVIVGINQYLDHRIRPLALAAADARAMYDVLTDPEYGRFAKQNVDLLLDKEATYRNIKEAIVVRLANRAKPDDTVVIYYAGHGAPLPVEHASSADSLEKYFIPHDAQVDSLRAHGIAMSDIQEWFRVIRSKRIMFFIDSCYSGAAGGRTFENPIFQTRGALTDEFLDQISGEGRSVISACDVNQVSLELPELGHGLFTHYLVRGLKGEADTNQDGLVSIDELYAWVFSQVRDHSARLGSSMEPIKRGDVKGDIYLTRYLTEAHKQAQVLSKTASEFLALGDIVAAEQQWKESLALMPENTEATNGLAQLEQRHLAEASERNRRISVLDQFEMSGSLSIKRYNQAVELLARDVQALNSAEALLHRRLLQLVDDEITIDTYLAAHGRYESDTDAMPQPKVQDERAFAAAEKPAVPVNSPPSKPMQQAPAPATTELSGTQESIAPQSSASNKSAVPETSGAASKHLDQAAPESIEPETGTAKDSPAPPDKAEARKRGWAPARWIALAMIVFGGLYYILTTTGTFSNSPESRVVTLPEPQGPVTDPSTEAGAVVHRRGGALPDLAAKADTVNADEKSAPPAPHLPELTVATTPASAKVEILSYQEEYYPGIALAAGQYQLKITAPGYGDWESPITMSSGSNRRVSVKLTPIDYVAENRLREAWLYDGNETTARQLKSKIDSYSDSLGSMKESASRIKTKNGTFYGGMLSFYELALRTYPELLTTLQDISEEPIYLNNVHSDGLTNQERFKFGHYNPRFVNWMIDFVLPAENEGAYQRSTQPVYDQHFRQLVRTFLEVQVIIENNPACFSREVERYKLLIENQKLPRFDYNRFYYFPRTGLSECSSVRFLNFSTNPNIVKTCVAFWVRRTIDGTDDEFARGLEKLLSIYDPGYSGAFRNRYRKLISN